MCVCEGGGTGGAAEEARTRYCGSDRVKGPVELVTCRRERGYAQRGRSNERDLKVKSPGE